MIFLFKFFFSIIFVIKNIIIPLIHLFKILNFRKKKKKKKKKK